MNIVERILGLGSPQLAGLADRLEGFVAARPELADDLGPIIAALRAEADPAGLVALEKTVAEELAELRRTQTLDPRNIPGNLA